ncbi:MAG: hypothetical protein ACLS4Z_05415 [Christensenellaceae bacterium]
MVGALKDNRCPFCGMEPLAARSKLTGGERSSATIVTALFTANDDRARQSPHDLRRMANGYGNTRLMIYSKWRTDTTIASPCLTNNNNRGDFRTA